MGQMNELELKTKVFGIEVQASLIEITDDDSFTEAAEFLRNIKQAAANVTNFFKDIKTAAHDSWKAICAKENEFKVPLASAEKTIKGKAVDYQMEQERIQREQEEELAKQLAIIERRKQEALEIAKKGDVAEYNALVLDEMLQDQEVPWIDIPIKAEGVSFRIDYEITVEDEKIVPCYIGKQCIRPVDLAEIKRLVKLNDGDIEIPGIEIKETKNMAVRR